MSRKTETVRLNKLAIKSGGYIAKVCPKCQWWRLKGGNEVAFEATYSSGMRCSCNKVKE